MSATASSARCAIMAGSADSGPAHPDLRRSTMIGPIRAVITTPTKESPAIVIVSHGGPELPASTLAQPPLFVRELYPAAQNPRSQNRSVSRVQRGGRITGHAY